MAGAHLEPRNISTLSTIVHDSFCSHSLTSRIMHSPYAFPDLEHKIFLQTGDRDRLVHVHGAAEGRAPLWRSSDLLWIPSPLSYFPKSS